MANVNKVILIGRLVRDVELKTTPSNQSVASIGLAVNHKYKTAGGEAREEVSFIDCEAWGKTAEVLNQYVGKGDPLYVEGRFKQDTWEDKDGGKRSKIKVVIENFQFLKGRDDGEKPREAPARAAAPGPRPVAGRVTNHPPMDESSIPF